MNIDSKEEIDFFQHHHPRAGRVLAGIFIVSIGVVWTASLLNYIQLPEWVFSWQMLLIIIGLYSGLKHLFRNMGWIFPVAIGVFFLSDKLIPGVEITNFIWPTLAIVVGLYLIFKPNKMNKWQKLKFKKKVRDEWGCGNPINAELHNDKIDLVAIMGGVKKNIISKDFKGGEITIVLGGGHLNFSQSDISETIELDLVQVMGGLKMILPSNWKVKTDIVTIMGGIEDKRKIINDSENEKILIIKGVAILGGIEISSY